MCLCVRLLPDFGLGMLYQDVPCTLQEAHTFSLASWAARKRLERCWFILARGATPSAPSECQP